jgi:hypothetical protein
MLRRKKRPILDLKSQKLIVSEYEECKAFWDYCQRVLKLGKTIIKIPNDERDDWFRRALVAIGLTVGACDYVYLSSNEIYHTCWIEMKRQDERGKRRRAEQDAFIDMLRRNGHFASYAYGAKDAIEILIGYINNVH